MALKDSQLLHRGQALSEYATAYQLQPTPGVRLCTTNLTVIVPAYNEATFIEQTLHGLGQSNQPIEIVVVDNGSQDHTKEVVAELSRQLTHPLVLLEALTQGPVYARKRGMDEVIAQYQAHQKHDQPHYIAMTDADTIVPSHWAATIRDTFQLTSAAAVGGWYHFPGELDVIVEEEFGLPDYFKYLPRISYFLASQGAALVMTNGANAAIEVEPYATVGGIQQPRNEQGDLVKGSDLRFGDEVRALGETVAFLPVMTTTSPRRELYALSQRQPYTQFSSMEGWVNPREQDLAFLKKLVRELTVADLLAHRAEQSLRFVIDIVVAPVLMGQVPLAALAQLTGQHDDLITALAAYTATHPNLSKSEALLLAQQIAELHGLSFLRNIEQLLPTDVDRHFS